MNHFFSLRILLFAICLFSFSCKTIDTNSQAIAQVVNSTKKALVKHTVLSDGHPMALREKKANQPKGIILFVHGRTWSGVPDFDLQVAGEDLSLMDGMLAQGYTSYAVDLRGYGATPRDETGWMTPDKAATDILNVLQWISEQNKDTKIHLFGWSMGSTAALLATQKNTAHIASLTLFGFWKDLEVTIPTPEVNPILEKNANTAKNAASDFITPNSISQKAIDTYVKMALKSDPIRVDWKDLHQYNALDPSLISTPTLVLQGEFDPIAPTDRQAKLFTRLKTGNKSWVVIAGGDHAAFMESPRPYFIHAFTAFISQF